MKRRFIVTALSVLMAGFAAAAHADLTGFLRNLDVQAKTDLHNFSVKVSTQFGVPLPRVEAVIRGVDRPSDAFMVFQLGQMTKLPPDRVMQTYSAHKGKGWGVIAKDLGIKPGSAEFHALRRGDLAFTGAPGGPGANMERGPGAGAAHGPGQGRGRGRGGKGGD